MLEGGEGIQHLNWQKFPVIDDKHGCFEIVGLLGYDAMSEDWKMPTPLRL